MAPAESGVAPLAGAIFLVALLLRLLHLWQIGRSPFHSVLFGDARAYDQWAQRIAAGDWVGQEVFYQAPLYPYFLGVIYSVAGRDLTIVRVCQAILGSASCVLVALTARRLFSKRAAMVAGFAMAIYAPAIFFDGLIQKSVLDVFFMSLALFSISGLVGRPFQGLALGLAMGALSLTRENALLLVVVVLGWMVIAKFPLKATTAFLLGVTFVLAPVAARNYAVGGGFYLTTSQFGPNFYIGNNPRADGTYRSLRPGRGSPEYERQDAIDLAQRAVGRDLTPGEVSSFWTDRAMAFIAGTPIAWLKLMGRKILLLVNRGEMLDTESQASYAEWSWPLKTTGWFTHFGVLVPLACIGVWATGAERRRLAIFYALTIAYASSVILFYVFARYRFPLVPILIVFAAPGLVAIPKALRRLLSTAGFAIALVTVIAISNWPLLSNALMKAITETNLATALYENTQYDDAIAHYRRAIWLRPDYAPAYMNMGAALRSKGRLAEAVAAYETSLRLQPENPDTHFNLANALLDLNRPQDAAEHFRLAGRRAPPGANVENNLGIALAAEGKMAEAAAAFRRAIAAEPDSARAHRNLGDALTSLGQFEEGVSHLSRATQLQPENATFHYDLAVTLLEGGRTPQAIEEFNEALKIDPALAPAHNNLGVALASRGRVDEAIHHFREALRIQPGYADAERNLQMAMQVRAKK